MSMPGGMSPADALAKTGEYSIFGLTRAGEPPVSRERRASFALVIFGIATVIAVRAMRVKDAGKKAAARSSALNKRIWC